MACWKPEDPVTSAKSAGLSYSTDRAPGIRRISKGRDFRYIDARGRLVRDRATLKRIRSLVIPPNWTDVWICAKAAGHLQVTARDSRGRKQYRYHPRYRAHRDETKFGGMPAFGRVLPRIRRRVARDLSRRGVPCERVLACIVHLLDCLCIRVGNAEYARDNDSYGLTTMRNRHVRIRGTKVQFRFKGKSGKLHELELDDPRLTAVVKRCRDLPGYELFEYLDNDGEIRAVDSAKVNQYLREISGQELSAKHFRTWHGTVDAAGALSRLGPATSQRELEQHLAAAVKEVAERLGNQPATCRKHYIHPAVVEAYSEGTLHRQLARGPLSGPPRGLSVAEQRVLLLLRRMRSRRGAKGRGPPRRRRGGELQR